MNTPQRSRRDQYAWAFEEIQILQNSPCDNYVEDFTSVYLEAPDAVEALEAAVSAITSNVSAYLAAHGYALATRYHGMVEKVCRIAACRRLVIIPEHPNRPPRPGFYSAGESQIHLEIQLKSMLCHNRFTFSVPERHATPELILKLMTMTAGSGFPVDLNYGDDGDGVKHYAVVFQSGRGLPDGDLRAKMSSLNALLSHHVEFLELTHNLHDRRLTAPRVQRLAKAVWQIFDHR